MSPSECADNDGHNTDAIDALTLTVPVIIKYADASPEERNRKVSIDNISHPYQLPHLHLLSLLMNCYFHFFIIGQGNNICNKKNSRSWPICRGFFWHAGFSFTWHWPKDSCWTVQSEFEWKWLTRRNDIWVSKRMPYMNMILDVSFNSSYCCIEDIYWLLPFSYFYL